MLADSHYPSLIKQSKLLKKAYFQSPEDHQNSQNFQKMMTIVEDLTLENFKIPQEFPTIPTQGVIHKEFGLRISLFFIPKGTKTILHDHPKMYVINKVLKGSLKKSQYALQSSKYQQQIPQKYVSCMDHTDQFTFPIILSTRFVQTIKVGHIDIITPENNLHKFEAYQDSIFIDVIAPDYDGVQIFYNTYKQREELGNGKVTLQMGPPKMQENYMMRVEMQ